MVDPVNLTNFGRTVPELEEVALFAVLVAGKNAMTTVKMLDRFLQHTHQVHCLSTWQPFQSVRPYSERVLSAMLRSFGFGCYTSKAKSVHQLVHGGLDLRTCSLEDLVAVHGVGFKTANMFLMHTRRGYRACCLDTHILKYLRDRGFDVPKASPQSAKKYREVQDIFLGVADEMGVDPTELDLRIWREYSGHEAA